MQPKKNVYSEDLNRHFSREEIQITSRPMKRCSTSIIIKKMQIRTPIRYHLIHVRIINRTQITSVRKDVEKKKPSYTVLGL